MYTLQDIRSWSLQDMENDPAKYNAIKKMYFGDSNPGSAGNLLAMWKSGYRNFNADKNYAADQAQNVTSELWRNLDRYGNWNNPANPNDYRQALLQREEGLKTLDEWKKRLTDLGIDFNSVPTLVSAYSSFGSTPGGGVTSQQAAQNPDFAHGNNGQPLPQNGQTSNYLMQQSDINDKPDNETVKRLYQSYIGRQPTQAEINNWGQTSGQGVTIKSLEDFLKQERTTYNITAPIQPIPSSQGGNGTIPSQTQTGNGNPAAVPPSGNGNSGGSGYLYDQAHLNSKANNAAVNQLYNSYFGRNATQAELNNWGQNGGPDTTVKALEDFLKQERIRYNVTTPIQPIPTSGGGTGTVPPSGGSGNGNGTPTPTPPSGNGTPNSTDAKWVNDLYQKYFDRTATSAEINNWISTNPQALEQFLTAEQKKYGYVSTAMGADRKKRYDDAIKMIDGSNLPDEIKQMWKLVVGQYPDATDFKPQEIIDTFNKIKNETVDPYFKELADVAITDLKTSFDELNVARGSELEAERANAGQAIRQAKSGLEKSGMTFTGKGIEELGGSSAYAQSGAAPDTMPVQTGFGGVDGMFYEGNVNQANRLISTSSAARYQSAQQSLGRNAENLLGYEGVKNALPGLQYTPGGVKLTGSLETQKQGKYASTLQGIIDNWRSAQQLKTNI